MCTCLTEKKIPSIFNDVLGPIMVGPSSSHTAGPARIGRLARDLLFEDLAEAIFTFETNGSFAACYHSQGSDKGFIGGLLGYSTGDERIAEAEKYAQEARIKITFMVQDYQATHPNTVKIKLIGKSGEQATMTAKSIGGGLIKVEEINGFSVAMNGDYTELLVFVTKNENEINQGIHRILTERAIKVHGSERSKNPNGILLSYKLNQEIDEESVKAIKNLYEGIQVRILKPVMPILSALDIKVPFKTAQEMTKNISDDTPSWKAAVMYEMARGNLTQKEVLKQAEQICHCMKISVKKGLGNKKGGNIIPSQAHLIKIADGNKRLIPSSIMNTVIAWSMAPMEVNCNHGVIVAAPTAGSCGILPGSILGVAEEVGADEVDEVKALLAAGIIGVFISEQATFAAEVCGCQAECGSSSAMAAAGLVQLMGGTTKQALAASSLALQNVLGLICDPVAGLVEVPCMSRNVMGSLNAIGASNMALAGVQEIVPLDEVIQAMYECGKMLPSQLRCTAKGGLSITPCGKRIAKNLG